MVDLGAQRAHHAELGAAEGQQARKAETRGKKAGVSSKTTRRKGGEKEATAQPAQKDLKKKNSTEMAIEDVPPEPGKTEGHEYVFEPVEYEEEVDLSGKLPQSCSV